MGKPVSVAAVVTAMTAMSWVVFSTQSVAQDSGVVNIPEPSREAPTIQDIEAKVTDINELAMKLAFRHRFDGKRNRDGEPAQQLAEAIKLQPQLTRTLMRATRGDSVKTFRESAEAVGGNLENIEKLSATADVSDDVVAMVRESRTLADFIRKHANEWQPIRFGEKTVETSAESGKTPKFLQLIFGRQ